MSARSSFVEKGVLLTKLFQVSQELTSAVILTKQDPELFTQLLDFISVSGLFSKKIFVFQVGGGLSSAGIHSFEEDNNLIGGLASSDHLCEPPEDGGGGGAGGRVRFVNSTVRYHMASGAAQTLWTGRTSLEKVLMVRLHQIVSPI